jgi:hypothetical protein
MHRNRIQQLNKQSIKRINEMRAGDKKALNSVKLESKSFSDYKRAGIA